MLFLRFFFLTILFSNAALGVSEQECTEIFHANKSRLQQQSINPAQAFMRALNEEFSSASGYEDCPQVLRSGPSFFQQAIITETQIMMAIEDGQTFPPDDLEGFFSSFPSYNPDANSILQRNQQNYASSRERCQPVDYREQMPPIRDQTDVGWCYAHAAADVISFSQGQSVSAVDLALLFNRYKNILRTREGEEELDLTMIDGCDPSVDRCFNEGGAGFYALALATNEGVCLDHALPSTSREGREYSEILINIEEIEEFVGQALTQEEAITHASSLCSSELGNFISDAFPLALVSDVAEILQEDEIQNGFFELANKSCRDSRIEVPGEVLVASRQNEGASRSVELIHEQLSSNNIAGIGYNPDLFSNVESAITSAGHESTVVGRRWNETMQSCQFLVRNTMGDSCDGYHSHVNCEAGHYWANENALLENIGQVYYLQ